VVINGTALSKNTILYITYGVIIALILGSIFAQPVLFSFGQKYQTLKLSIFGGFIILFSIVQFIFLRSINRVNRMIKVNTLRKFRITKIHRLVTICQFVIIGILVVIFVQILINESYDSLLSVATVWLAHVFTIGLLVMLLKHFFSWFRHNREIGVLSFTIAIAIICINLVFMLSYFTNEIRDDPRNVTSYRGQTTPFGSPYNIYQQGYVLTYILSFIAIWSATVLLLRHYSKRIGTIKFWIILSIPLIYFTLQYQTSFLEILLPFRLSNPVLFGIIYTIIFSAAKPIGGILAGIAFWTIAKTVNQAYVKYYMMLSACGIMLLFASNLGGRLVAPSFPPTELVVVSFMVLSSYYLLIGIYHSAISVAHDTKLRRYVIQSKKSVEKQLGFLGSIGSSEMEQEVQKRVETITKNFVDKIERDTGIPPSLDENEIREYIQMIIRERKE
jgi:hypothetical protein